MAIRKSELGGPRNVNGTLCDNDSSKGECVAVTERLPVTITTEDGSVFEIADAPVRSGRITTLAGEQTLRKLWDNPQEDEVWRSISEEI